MMDATALQPGSRAVLTGLVKKPELNGKLVHIVKYIDKEERFKVRPIGQQAKSVAPTPHIAIRAENLKKVAPSAFVTMCTYQDQELEIPLRCRVGRDGFGKAGIYLMYDNWMGLDRIIPILKLFFGDEACDWTKEEEVRDILESEPFGNATSPIYDERAQRTLKDNEVLIIRKKQKQHLDAMLDFELVEETNKTAEVGMYGDLPLFKILFPFKFE